MLGDREAKKGITIRAGVIGPDHHEEGGMLTCNEARKNIFGIEVIHWGIFCYSNALF